MFARPVRPFRALVVAVAGFALLASAGAAQADTINFSGNTNSLAADPIAGYDPVSFSGTVTVNAINSTSASVSIMLKNTTSVGDAVTKGYITGFGFNLPDGMTTTSAKVGNFNFLTSGGATTSLLSSAEFDYAFSLSSKELHTVERGLGLTTAQAKTLIASGLGAGQFATFNFVVSGTGAGALTASQIIEDKSGSNSPFAVRFRSTDVTKYKGHNDPDGDKVTASVDKPPTNGVPAPPGVVLAGIGFGSILLGRLRRRK